MALYAIGDTHLSLSSDKPMDVFGGAWTGYVEKLRQGMSVLQEEDTIVLCGDLSWGMSLPQAREDFAFLAAFPGAQAAAEGEPRLLVDHCGENDTVFSGERLRGV